MSRSIGNAGFSVVARSGTAVSERGCDGIKTKSVQSGYKLLPAV